MRRIRANAIAILTVAWILGTFYYLWQDNKPQSSSASSSSSSSSSASQTRGRSHGQKAVSGRLEIHRDDRTIPLIVSELLLGDEGRQRERLQGSVCCMLMCMCVITGDEDGGGGVGEDAQLGVTAGTGRPGAHRSALCPAFIRVPDQLPPSRLSAPCCVSARPPENPQVNLRGFP